MNKNTRLLERTYTIWGLALIFWSLYRAFVRLPEPIDEFVAKPLIFLVPAITYVLFVEKRPLSSIGLRFGKFTRDIYLGLGFGAIFAIEGIAANIVKHGVVSVMPAITVDSPTLLLFLALSVATAFTEEVLVRGFLYTHLKEGYGSEIKALVVATLMYFMLLIPILFTRLHLTDMTLAMFLGTNLILSLANTMIFNETKTLTVPILIHVFWNMAVLLYM
jgi:membrane protease YdiL (CAAX protease family)